MYLNSFVYHAGRYSLLTGQLAGHLKELMKTPLLQEWGRGEEVGKLRRREGHESGEGEGMGQETGQYMEERMEEMFTTLHFTSWLHPLLQTRGAVCKVASDVITHFGVDSGVGSHVNPEQRLTTVHKWKVSGGTLEWEWE